MHIVTGGAGFIGSAYVARLNAAGIVDVVIVDEKGDAKKDLNLKNLKFLDYWDKSELSKRLGSGIKSIVHMGACSSTTEKNWEYLRQNNFEYSKSLCEFAVKHGIRFVYASSAATYGAGENGYADDDTLTPKLMPLNLYGKSKLMFDQWVIDSGLTNKVTGLKFFNVFGPNEYHKGEMRSLVHKAYEQIKSTGQVRLFKSYRAEFKDGEQKRDFIYVKDCTEVMFWLLEHPKVNGIFNLGTGRARSWLDLTQAIFAALGINPKIEFIEMPEDLKNQYQYFTEAKMQKLEDAGCPVKFRTLEENVRNYVTAYLEQADPYLR